MTLESKKNTGSFKMEIKKYQDKLEEILISSAAIQKKVKWVAGKIEKDYKGREIVLVSNLVGSFRFLSDLTSYLNIPAMIDFIAFTGYKGTKSSGQLRIIKDLKIDIKGKHVIIVEDIIDSGLTISFIIKHLNDFKFPASIKICTLLDKACKRTVEVPIDYKCFEIEDRFIVGYGLDHDEYYRELNDIYILKS